MPTKDITEEGGRLLPGERVIEEEGRRLSEEGVTEEEGRLLPSTVEVLTGLVFAVADLRRKPILHSVLATKTRQAPTENIKHTKPSYKE